MFLRFRSASLLLVAENTVDDLPCRVADDSACTFVSPGHRRHEGAGFLEGDMRRKRGYVRIGLHF
jgi:hypothetical protein